jgi:N-acetylmuramoyl-L-alanine amidase
MTRDSDTFVELFRRTQIANEANGKLFVSIHCNSMPTKPHPANGCETYILRPGRNEDAARVAAQENASVKFERSQDRYKAMTEDQLIVATMAQIQQRVSTATGLTNRGVNQAGFFVLVGASMPNLLFETAFLSNNKDAAYISSSAGQNATAKAMLTAISDYAAFYERSLKN